MRRFNQTCWNTESEEVYIQWSNQTLDNTTNLKKQWDYNLTQNIKEWKIILNVTSMKDNATQAWMHQGNIRPWNDEKKGCK